MADSRIRKVLIANRGEISLRIQRACRKLGIRSVAALSEADVNSYFARASEETVLIGPPPPTESYLHIGRLVEAALNSGCDAVHPGYGFLSENADFAAAVIGAGLIFIGPDPETIRIMGSKTLARERVTEFGVPCTPGTFSSLPDADTIREAERIGFPVIIKAVAGGGGRGMRVVRSAAEMKEALERARAEALKNFASAEVYIEKYIEEPRHVEVQVFGDSHGNILHFGTRDCSSQRRHQKLIEEAPAPNLSAALREAIHSAAVNAARSVQYKGAGTVEFLVKNEDFYFLEMNTRIQVEHPVTEAITGVDLVELQIRVAEGASLPMKQEEVSFKGHGIEFRIYAEDPANGFRPATGRIGKVSRVQDEFLREDYAYEEGDVISPYYDAMLSKLIVTGATRREAILRSRRILAEYSVADLPNTIGFHRWLLFHPSFLNAPVDIGFIEREFKPDSLKLVSARSLRDPRHRIAAHGALVKEMLQYRSTSFGRSYDVEVLHRSEGDFLFKPADVPGRQVRPIHARLSNSFEAGLKALIDEVLEKESFDEIYVPAGQG